MKQVRTSYALDPAYERTICPRCGKRTFRLYRRFGGRAFSPDVGLCTRKTSCNWHYTPYDYSHDVYYGLRPKGNDAQMCLGNDEGGLNAASNHPDYIDPAIFAESILANGENPLLDYLHRLVGDYVAEDVVTKIVGNLGIGYVAGDVGCPIFWEIDYRKNIRDGRIVEFSPGVGKRFSEMIVARGEIEVRGRDGGRENRKRCWFGSHLAGGEEDGRVIFLFENMTDPLAMAILLRWLKYPYSYALIGCEGKESLNPIPERLLDPYDAMAVLRGRNVVLLPNQGNYEDWKRRGEMLSGFVKGWRVSRVMEQYYDKPEWGRMMAGCGIGDLIMRIFEIKPKTYLEIRRMEDVFIDLLNMI